MESDVKMRGLKCSYYWLERHNRQNLVNINNCWDNKFFFTIACCFLTLWLQPNLESSLDQSCVQMGACPPLVWTWPQCGTLYPLSLTATSANCQEQLMCPFPSAPMRMHTHTHVCTHTQEYNGTGDVCKFMRRPLASQHLNNNKRHDC